MHGNYYGFELKLWSWQLEVIELTKNTAHIVATICTAFTMRAEMRELEFPVPKMPIPANILATT